MLLIAARGLPLILLFAFWIYCIFDVIASEESLVRNLPKPLWLLLVIVLPDVGGLAWLILGRPARAGWVPGQTEYGKSRRPIGPDDDPDFMSRRLRAWEDDLRRREDEMRRREQGES